MISDAKSAVLKLFLYNNVSFFFGYIQDSFFVFCFQQTDYHPSTPGFVWVYLVWDLLSFFESVGLCFFTKFRKFSDISSNDPSALYFLFSSWHKFKPFGVVLQIPEAWVFCFVFPNFLSLLFRLDHFYGSVSKFMHSLFSPLSCYRKDSWVSHYSV